MPAEEGSTTTSKVKESAVISDGSLSILAREIAKEKEDGLVFAMYLCIPNTTIVHACNSASEVGLKDASEQLKIETCQSLLLTWKGLKAGCKEREKVRELERALREMGKTEMADVINDKHANNVELTVEALAV